VRPVLDAIRELAGPETANDYANRVVKASLPESGAVDAAAADTLVDCLDILSGTGFREPEWLKLAATVARQITPVERVRLIGWIREHA
jgi:hypothetical protein